MVFNDEMLCEYRVEYISTTFVGVVMCDFHLGSV